MPTALSVCGSVAHTAVACTKAAGLDATHTFFDPEARQCFGLQVILAIIAECRKAGKPCHLSMGLVDESLASAVDILSPKENDPSGVQAVRLRYRPSIADGELFAFLTEVDLLRNDRRPQAVVRQALDLARRHQDKQQCDLFARLAVGSGPTVQWLYLIDIAAPQRLRYAMAQHDALSAPFVDGDTLPRPEMILPTMLFGVCARARLLLLHSLPGDCSADDVQHLKALMSLRNLVCFPGPPSRTSVDTHALAHRLAAEVHRLRNQVNFFARNAQKAAESAVVGDALQNCMEDLAEVRTVLSKQLPKLADSKDRSRRAATAVLRGRLSVLAQLEQEASERDTALQRYHEWLTSVRVMEPNTTAEAIPYVERVRVLEKTVETQRDELERLRRVVGRDMAVLHAEFGVLRQAVEAKTPLECIFRSTLERFAQEAALLAGDDPDLACSRAILAVNQLTEKLQYDTALFFGSSTTTPPKLESEACAQLFRASVDQLRRNLGIPIEPPVTFADSTEAYWHDMVMSHYAARAERYKLRCLADGLALHCRRLEAAVDNVSTSIASMVSTADAALIAARHDIVGDGELSKAHMHVLAELHNSAPTVLRPTAGSLFTESKKLRDAGAALELRAEKCRGIVDALRSAAQATESLMEGGATEDLADGADDMAEYILQRYTRGAGATSFVTGVAMEDAADENGEAGGGLSVRLEEIMTNASRGQTQARKATKAIKAQVKRGIFSTMVLDSALAPTKAVASPALIRGGNATTMVAPRSRTPKR
jgi:hypothetical protein